MSLYRKIADWPGETVAEKVAACIQRNMPRSVLRCAPRSIFGSLAVRAQTSSSLASIPTASIEDLAISPRNFRRPPAMHLRSLHCRRNLFAGFVYSNKSIHPNRLHCCSWRFVSVAPCSRSLLSVGHHCSSCGKHKRGDVCSGGMCRWVGDGFPSALLAVVAEEERGRRPASRRDAR